ncbi:MAG: Fe-Mn family superoxide dismutase [Actinomycetota bacterium]
MKEMTVKPLAFTSLPGLSEKLLSEHHDVLYAGYVKKLNEIRSKLETADRAEANASYSLFGELKREETFTANAVKLHEAYFDNLGGNGQPDDAILEMISRDCGGVDTWRAEMTASGIAARGWVVAAYDLDLACLITYICDTHNLGCIWNAVPLVVLDVYEHAYYLDYATGRKSYIEAVLNNLNFAYANDLIKRSDLR